ncbi:class I adenylate-forming enzyme family protein [Actinomadura sp. 3N508]|uniref:class I adenylate-forming enzyme family protein n=1 Tax=Actinomadura sp. 3N508 TaxID=3375153 RepID=UPI0037908E3A
MLSKGSDPAAVYPAVTVTRAVLGASGADPGRAAVVDVASGRSVTYAELATMVDAAASGLAREGIGPGDVVGLYLRDGPEFAVALHAVTTAGAVPFPVDAPHLVDAVRAKAVVTSSGRFDGQARALGIWGLVAAGSGRVSLPDADPDRDTALLACTRGPGRTVRLTHAEVVAGLVRVADAGMIGGGDTVLSALPFADVLGLNGVLNPALRLGATVVGLGGHDLLRALRDHRATVAVLPPRLVRSLACDRAVSRYDLHRLRAVVAAGGPLAAEDARAAAARLGCPVRQAYGLAEAAGFTHLNLRAAEEGTLDSVGRGLPGVTWHIVDPRSGVSQPSYRPGELCVRLPVARTADVPVRWLPTGDSAFADDHGRVFVLGRATGVRPDPPGEPETVLAAHPSVGDAAVIPVPDGDLGLAPHAFVVLTAPASEIDLLRHVNGHVPRTRAVSAVHVVDEIPRTPGGEIRRRKLLERAGFGH